MSDAREQRPTTSGAPAPATPAVPSVQAKASGGGALRQAARTTDYAGGQALYAPPGGPPVQMASAADNLIPAKVQSIQTILGNFRAAPTPSLAVVALRAYDNLFELAAKGHRGQIPPSVWAGWSELSSYASGHAGDRSVWSAYQAALTASVHPSVLVLQQVPSSARTQKPQTPTTPATTTKTPVIPQKTVATRAQVATPKSPSSKAARVVHGTTPATNPQAPAKPVAPLEQDLPESWKEAAAKPIGDTAASTKTQASAPTYFNNLDEDVAKAIDKGASAVLELWRECAKKGRKNAFEGILREQLEGLAGLRRDAGFARLLLDIHAGTNEPAIRLPIAGLWQRHFYGAPEHARGDQQIRAAHPEKKLPDSDAIRNARDDASADLDLLRKAMKSLEPALRQLATEKYLKARRAQLDAGATADELLVAYQEGYEALSQYARTLYMRDYLLEHPELAPRFAVDLKEALRARRLGPEALLALHRRAKDAGLRASVEDLYLEAIGAEAATAKPDQLARYVRSGIPRAVELAEKQFFDRYRLSYDYEMYRPTFGLPPLPPRPEKQKPATPPKPAEKAPSEQTTSQPAEVSGEGASQPASNEPEDLLKDDRTPEQRARDEAGFEAYVAEQDRKKADIKSPSPTDFGGQVGAMLTQLLGKDKNLSAKFEGSGEMPTAVPMLFLTAGLKVSVGWTDGKCKVAGQLDFGVKGKLPLAVADLEAQLNGTLAVEAEAADPVAAMRIIMLALRRRIEAVSPEVAGLIYGGAKADTRSIAKGDKATLSAGLEASGTASGGGAEGKIAVGQKREYETSGATADEPANVTDKTEASFSIKGGLIESEAKASWSNTPGTDEATFTATGTLPYSDPRGLAMLLGKVAELSLNAGKRGKMFTELANTLKKHSDTVIAALAGKGEGKGKIVVEGKRVNGVWTGSIKLTQTTGGSTLDVGLIKGEGEVSSTFLDLKFP